ncbi:MAG TPA: ABC transporter substrate-binding protein [Chloroflexota bacterium]
MKAAYVIGVLLVLVLVALGWHHATRPPPHHPLPPDTGMAQVGASGVLRVAMDASYPPFAIAAADGSLHGLDVDLARAIAGQLHVTASLVNISEDGLPDALIANQADVVISEQRPDPRLRLAYSMPYYNAGQVLLVAVNDRRITRFADLRQQTVGVELGSDADEWLRRQQTTPVLVQRYSTVAGAIKDLTAGAIAGVVTDAPTAAILLRQSDTIRLDGPALTQDPYVVAAAPQNLSLIRAVNKALTLLQADGTLSALLTKDV